MCYSAQFEADLRIVERLTGARIDLAAFYQLFLDRVQNEYIKIPKALELHFLYSTDPAEGAIRDLIAEYNKSRLAELQEELFAQKRRLADAERKLAVKPTKKDAESQRIAGAKVQKHLDWIADIGRSTLEKRDSRIYPQHFAPVVINPGDGPVIRPMRYLCRPAGKPSFYDRKFSGCYNARRDNLEGFWQGQFASTHAVMVATAFYENVQRHDFERRELREGEKPENLVIKFAPRGLPEMLVACLWSHWEGAGERPLDSFAAITDEPPPEVAAAGHDRCIIPIKPENVAAWLSPAKLSKPEVYAILDERERPYYENKLAA